ncbi:MAG TPA: hypothetical protein VGQ81_07260 [Acidobacteriota bacterium]|jgi:hypothetical protein|nr:hypothetical protein [Acidobacteriota bacterium]
MQGEGRKGKGERGREKREGRKGKGERGREKGEECGGVGEEEKGELKELAFKVRDNKVETRFFFCSPTPFPLPSSPFPLLPSLFSLHPAPPCPRVPWQPNLFELLTV